MKLCVISAIFSNNGNPIDIPFVKDKIPNADYILFTNCKILLNIYTGWNIVIKPIEFNSAIYTARKYKWITHSQLKDRYDIMIWVDGHLSPNVKFNWNKIINFYKNGYDNIILKKHPSCICIYDECVRCYKQNKINFKLSKKILSFLKGNKMPINYGLYETNILVKPLKNKKLNKILNNFFYNLLNISYRDQTLLTYCLWKNKWNNFLLLNNFGNNFYVKSGKINKSHSYI